MRMGLLTNSLADIGIKDLRVIADWAKEQGIAELDVGPSLPLDEEAFADVQADGKIRINTLIYCRNFLSPDAEEAQAHQKALRDRIEFAGRNHIEKIVCSTGVMPESVAGMAFAPEKSLDACVELFLGFLDLAEKNDVKLCWENCPMMGNIATSPDMFRQLFDRLDSKRIGLCYDPSHFVWQGIDAYAPILEFREKIFHFHGKDTQVDRAALREYGALQNVRWWRHRLPGLGDLDWGRIVDMLYEIDYAGAICIEHEDPVWSGTEEKVKRGILKTRDHISGFFM